MKRTLSAREKKLGAIVVGTAFVFLNVWLIDTAISLHTSLSTDLSRKEKRLRLARGIGEDLAFWTERVQWIQATQPHLTNADSAGVQLLNTTTDLAKKHGLLPEKPALRPVERQPTYQSVSVDLETKSSWKPLISFLRDLQSPDTYVVLESGNLKIDPADPTQLRCRFKIARWFAPK